MLTLTHEGETLTTRKAFCGDGWYRLTDGRYAYVFLYSDAVGFRVRDLPPCLRHHSLTTTSPESPMPASASSTWLSERLIARLSTQRIGNLERRIRVRIVDADNDLARGNLSRREAIRIHAAQRRWLRSFGRLAALT